MKHLLVIALFVLTIGSKAQEQTGVTYYSDKYGSKEVAKGPYQKELKKLNDSVTSEVFSKTKTGQKIWEKSYIGEQPFGIWKWYDKKGRVKSEKNYDFVLKYGAFIPENSFNLEELGVDKKLDENTQKIQRHIRDNFRYPEIAQELGIQGKVTVQFTIDKNGKIENLRILKGVALPLDTECFRIMNLLKELKPYQKDGENVTVYYTIPITFRLA